MGHENQKKASQRQLERGSLPRAMIFSGPAGIGKRLFTADIAAALLGLGSLERKPDAWLLAPGISKETGKPTDIPVESVRDMKVWAYQRPLYNSSKLVLIDDADRLSDPASNTLLKVLEEPPAYLHFILVSSLPTALLPTIRSRCQEISFAPLTDTQTAEALSDLALTVEDKKLLTAVAAGRPGTARALVQEGRLPEVSHAIANLQQCLKSGVAERLALAKTITEDDTMRDVVAWWLSWVHAQLDAKPKLAPVARGLLELSSTLQESKYNQRLALDRFLLEMPTVV